MKAIHRLPMKAYNRLSQLLGNTGVARQCSVIITIGILLLIAIGPAKFFGLYTSYIIALALIYAIGTMNVSMLAHTAGIWSIGHTTFLAIGAYLAAFMSTRGVPVEVIILTAMAVSLLIGLVVGISAGRFAVLYMALLTMAMGLVAFEVIGRWRTVTGGDQGTVVAPARLLFLNRPLNSTEVILMTVVITTLIFLAAQIVYNGATGKRWLAIKSQPLAAMSIGLKPHLENALAFGFSGALTSTAGVCMAYSIRYVGMESFELNVSIMMVLTAMVGGIGNILGGLMGGVFLALVPELAREVRGASEYVFGTATILVILFLPGGIVPGITRLIRRLKPVVAKDETIESALLEPSSPDEMSDAITTLVSELMTGAKKTLTVEGVSVSFGGLKALDDVSLQVTPGQVVGLIGPNGAGKTTLLNTLSGYVLPTQVSIMRLGNTNLVPLPAYARPAHGFGRTFQHAELFQELSIRESVLQAARQGAANRKKAGHIQDPVAVTDQLLNALRLRRYAQAYPSEVPFGVQKVTDIARALATGAQIIAMDEPFSGLDAAERDEVRTILQAMRKAGVSILIIDHVVQEVFNIADQVVVLDFGRILATGSPQEIQKNPQVLEAYLGSSYKCEEVQVHGE